MMNPRLFLYVLFLIGALQQVVFAQEQLQESIPAPDAAHLSVLMRQMDALSAHEIGQLFLQLKAQGNDHAKIEYAGNSYAYEVMRTGNEAMRIKFVEGAQEALAGLADGDNKGFILNLLQHTGKDEVVSEVAKYLADDYLADRAARTLAQIHSEKSGKALLDALAQAKDQVKPTIIEALGDAGYKKAAPQLQALIAAEDLSIRKTALYSLSIFGLPSSEESLRKAVEKVHFAYEESNATAAYIRYANQLIQQNEQATAKKAGEFLLKADAAQVPVRIAGISILTKLQGERYGVQLLKAARDQQASYSVAAIKLAEPFIKGVEIKRWGKSLKKMQAPTQAALLKILGNVGDKSVNPDIEQAMERPDSLIRQSAIKAYAKLNGTDGLVLLLGHLEQAKAADLPAYKEALSTMKGPGVEEKLMAVLHQASSFNQILLMDALAQRRAKIAFSSVQKLLKAPDPAVRAAAYRNLPAVVSDKELNFLLQALQETGLSPEKDFLQQALVTSISEHEDPKEALSAVLTYYEKASLEQRARLLPVLAGMGGQEALLIVLTCLESGDDELRYAAIEALANWKDGEALPALQKWSRTIEPESQRETLIKGTVRLVKETNLPSEQKVLYLRDMMEVATQLAQKKTILSAIAENPTYNALFFVGKYLDDQELHTTAATAVVNIALANPDLYGVDVRDLLNKTWTSFGENNGIYQREPLLKHMQSLPLTRGWISLFNGKNLREWKGLVGDPLKRAKMSEKELAEAQVEANEEMRKGWHVKDGVLFFSGEGKNIATAKTYGDFDLLVDWRLSPIGKDGDAGVYLRGTPQVQIWDTSRVRVGAQVGSGGLYNNKENPSKPLLVADNPLGEWNTFYIQMEGDKVTVYLNGKLVTDHVTLENYWDRNRSIFPVEQLELQAHGTEVSYRDIYIREHPNKEVFNLNEAEQKDGFQVLFDGTNLDAWTGNKTAYRVSKEGTLSIYPSQKGGNLYTKEEYADFIYRFSFRLTPGANNGIGIRAPLEGDAAYAGMEIQILDHDDPRYNHIEQYQYHGSVYGVIPAKRSVLKPLGEWNEEEIYVKGNHIKVTLNGEVILDGDIAEASKNGTIDGKSHPGLKSRIGHIGLLGHGTEVDFKNIRIKRL